jgi:glyoxylase-like metal-dependent hydrolase (beta-lactamase superfamily II)
MAYALKPPLTAIHIPLGDNVLYPLTLANGSTLLVDAGPDFTINTTSAWPLLTTQLAAHNIEVGDVTHVLITHAHLDHAGLAHRWATEGATILAGTADIPAIAAGLQSHEAQRAAQLRDLIRHGCPEDLVPQMRSPPSDSPLRWEPCPSAALSPPATSYDLADGLTLEVIDAPGHTPGNLVAFIPQTGELFSGDTILPTTVPTPGMHYPTAIDGLEKPERWPSLPPFIDSVAHIRTISPRRILPGHGEPVEQPETLFTRFETHHERRAKRIRRLLEEQSDTAFGIARRQFPRLPPRRLAQAITETFGHLDLLARQGVLETFEQGRHLHHRLVD